MWEYALFWIFAIAACGGAISVVISQNVVRMALGLIASLASVSALFFLLSADFVGATQLMVYVGGTVVLVIFGVMLTSSSALLKIKASPADGVLAAGIGAIFLLMVAFTIGSIGSEEDQDESIADRNSAQDAWNKYPPAPKQGYNDESEGNTVRPLAMSFVGLRPDDTSKPGYLLPFEIVSVHLLVVLVGAAYLARAKRRVNTESQQS